VTVAAPKAAPIGRASEPERRRTGRRPGPSRTRKQILAAARISFARRGFDATSIRGVAASAKVDPALVRRFFGSKEQLLIAALSDAMRPSEGLSEVLAGDLETLGERLIRYMLEVWEHPRANREVLIGMIRAAATNARGARFLRDFIGSEILKRLGARLDRPEAQLRASLVGSQIVGLAFYRYVLEVEPLASATPEQLGGLIGPTLRRYLTGPLPA
jgi:AcrR family transcriptional regulator